MFNVTIQNLDPFIPFQKLEGCNFNLKNNPVDKGMAFDSQLADFVFSFANDVAIALVVEYIFNILLSQRDDRGQRNIKIENVTININSISDEDLEIKITDIVEKMEKTKNE